MYLSILFLPLLGSMVAGLLGRKLGSTGAQFITISSLAITSVMVLVAFYEVGLCASPVVNRDVPFRAGAARNQGTKIKAPIK